MLAYRISLGAALLGCLACGSQVPAIEGRVETFTFASQVVGDRYKIQVRLPPGYDAGSALYPVVYQLDGTSFGPEFQITAGHASALEKSAAIPASIVVGIGYPYTDPLVSETQGRGRDYVTQFADGKTGGADAFIQFMLTELLPDIDAKYRTDPTHRVLSGHSLGGFMSLYTFFTTYRQPSPAFWGFVVGDPSLSDNDLRLFDEEGKLFAAAVAPRAPVWIEVARYDGAVQRLLFGALRDRLQAHYPGLRLGSEILDTDHGGTISPGFRNGLKHVLGDLS